MTTTPRHVRADRRPRGSGSISRRGESFEVVRVYAFRRYRQTVHTKAEGEQVLARWDERIAQGLAPDPVFKPRRRAW